MLSEGTETEYKLQALGMGLSGCEDSVENEKFVRELVSRYEKLSEFVIAVSDAVGPIYTACPDG